MCIVCKPYQSRPDGVALVTALFKFTVVAGHTFNKLEELITGTANAGSHGSKGFVPFVFSVELLIPSPSQSEVFQLEEGVLVWLAKTNEQASIGSVPSKPS
jgi:hypothetical protein